MRVYFFKLFPRAATSDYIALLLLGIALGMVHQPIALQISVGSSFQAGFAQSMVAFLYPISLALTGFGAALYHSKPLWSPIVVVRAAGLSLALTLLAVLRSTLFSESWFELTASWLSVIATLGAWYAASGWLIARFLQRSTSYGSAAPGWCVHLLGLSIGYLFGYYLISPIGANLLIFALAISLLTRARVFFPIFFIITTVGASLGLDAMIENLRFLPRAGESLRHQFDGHHSHAPFTEDRLLSNRNQRVDFLWGPYGQVLFKKIFSGDREHTVAYYSFWPQFIVNDTSEIPSRRGLYNLFGPEDRIAIIGAGAGRGIHSFRFPLTKNIISIERNSAAVDYIRKHRNDLPINRTDYISAEGRFVIESAAQTFDGILIEGARFQKKALFLPYTDTYHLFTKEAVDTFLGKLNPGGLLLYELSPNSRGYIVYAHQQAAEWARRAEAFVQWVRFGEYRYLVICPRQECLDPLFRQSATHRLYSKQTGPPPNSNCAHSLTDNRPFAKWNCSSFERKFSFIIFALVAVLAALSIFSFSARRHGFTASAVFLILGFSHVALQMHAFLKWRSFFGDESLTILRLIVYFLLFGGLGSLFSARLTARPPKRTFFLLVVLLFLHALATAAIPFSVSDPILRAFLAAVLLLPGGLLMGAYFPLALHRFKSIPLGFLLGADSLGTLVGFGLLFLAALPFGLDALLWIGLAGYGLCAGLLFFPAERPAQA